MTLFHALTLGVVEGVTEFLPVSSTGHLILAARLLRVAATPFVTSFEVAIQLGAVLAVAVRYGRLLARNVKFVLVLAVGFVPAAVVGLVFYRFIKLYLLGSTTVVLAALALGGVAILLFERWYAQRVAPQDIAVTEITYRQAFAVGCCQALAVVPGVSRAAATILGGLALGLPRRAVVEFSFLLAIPTMLAATVLDLAKVAGTFSGDELGLLAVGFATSFTIAWASVRWLLAFVERHTFTVFGWYRLALAVAGWLLFTVANW